MPRGVAHCVETMAERVFDALTVLRDLVIELAGSAQAEQLQRKDIAGIRQATLGLLLAHRDIVVGMGLIAAPGLLADHRRRLHWWQFVPGREEPAPLRVDLDPDSLGFYDCDSADWFSVPRTSGRRHVVGPYIDAHGTDRHLLTFTMPISPAGSFLGVVGADVPVSVFENRMLRAWGRQEQRRDDHQHPGPGGGVQLDQGAGRGPGDRGIGRAAGTAIDLADLPWQVRVTARG